MIVLSCGLTLPLCCNNVHGHRKGGRFEAKADNLVGVIAHCSFAHLFPTQVENKRPDARYGSQHTLL